MNSGLSGNTSETEHRIFELCDLEKKRIGRDLHDGVGQLLTGISLKCKALESRLGEQNNPETAELHKLSVIVDNVIRRIREVVSGLSPSELQHQDAATSLRQLCQQTEDLYHIQCIFSESRPPLLITDPDKVKHLYFIVAESIHNAIRHGEADQIKVQLCQGTDPHQVELIIHNNGNCEEDDFSKLTGIGLRGMQFRAQALNGRLYIERCPNDTMAVICSFSLL